MHGKLSVWLSSLLELYKNQHIFFTQVAATAIAQLIFAWKLQFLGGKNSLNSGDGYSVTPGLRELPVFLRVAGYLHLVWAQYPSQIS